ncbi:hypothetical protein [Chondrinema litorale]|uniref:hypothetical protein n=1 Tax=Chondrinema litorale TaxID=2994555 RepID=UPI002542D641|nr:hypothetical protein [Chondrinema litorale]UZR93432.1 hypothetical protein OQ292_16375 [Chondrinema litorale]
MNFKTLLPAIFTLFLSFTVFANNDKIETAPSFDAYSVFSNMDASSSKSFFDEMGITTETIGNEIFFIYNEAPAFILNKKTEYLILPDPNGGFTIESEKSYVIANVNNENVLEFSHLNKKSLKLKRYRKQ